MFMTAEVVEGFPAVHVLSEKVSFITDDILLQRFVEIEGELHRVISVVKMRGSDHSKAFLTYDITAAGARVGAPLTNYHGILTGIPTVLIVIDEKTGVPHRPKGRPDKPHKKMR
jgi:circadian clock protein KaiC